MGLGLFIVLNVSLQYVLDLFSHQFSLHGHGKPMLHHKSLPNVTLFILELLLMNPIYINRRQHYCSNIPL